MITWSKCAAFIFLIVGLTACAAIAQPAKEVKSQPAASTQSTKPPDPNFIRWKLYLDILAQEARSVAEERRPYVVAEIATAYWELDREESQAMFISALDAAWKLAEQDKKYRDMLDDVLAA